MCIENFRFSHNANIVGWSEFSEKWTSAHVELSNFHRTNIFLCRCETCCKRCVQGNDYIIHKRNIKCESNSCKSFAGKLSRINQAAMANFFQTRQRWNTKRWYWILNFNFWKQWFYCDISDKFRSAITTEMYNMRNAVIFFSTYRENVLRSSHAVLPTSYIINFLNVSAAFLGSHGYCTQKNKRRKSKYLLLWALWKYDVAKNSTVHFLKRSV